MLKKLLVAFVATSAVASSAMAARYHVRYPQQAPRPQQAYGLYIGLTAGQAFHYDTANTTLDGVTYSTTADQKIGAGIQLGYLFSRFGGIEFGAENLGTPYLQTVNSSDVTTTNTENAEASYFSLVGQIPFNPADPRAMLIAKLGIAEVALGDDLLAQDAAAVRMELGLGFEVSPQVMFTVSYTHYLMMDTYFNGSFNRKDLAAPIGYAAVGLRYQF